MITRRLKAYSDDHIFRHRLLMAGAQQEVGMPVLHS